MLSNREIALARAVLAAAKELRRLQDVGCPVDADVMQYIGGKAKLAMPKTGR